MRVKGGSPVVLLLAAIWTLYALWLTFVYSRPRYDTPCGSLLGPSNNYFGWDTSGTCGLTHWWSAGLAVYCVLVAVALVATARSSAAAGVVMVAALTCSLGALPVLVLIAESYPEPVLGEAWTAARDMLAITVAFQALAVALYFGTRVVRDRPTES